VRKFESYRPANGVAGYQLAADSLDIGEAALIG